MTFEITSALKPDRVMRVFWKDVELRPGKNVLRRTAGRLTAERSIVLGP